MIVAHQNDFKTSLDVRAFAIIYVNTINITVLCKVHIYINMSL
jgi:hypothetical protein